MPKFKFRTCSLRCINLFLLTIWISTGIPLVFKSTPATQISLPFAAMQMGTTPSPMTGAVPIVAGVLHAKATLSLLQRNLVIVFIGGHSMTIGCPSRLLKKESK